MPAVAPQAKRVLDFDAGDVLILSQSRRMVGVQKFRGASEQRLCGT
jgi:hypothetical protein